MALSTLKEILADAQKKQYGVGYFNAVNLEMVRAYVRAADDMRSPIVIGTSEGLLRFADFDWFAPVLLNAAKLAKAPVAIHLDHAYRFDVVMRALRAGFGSVMFDGSALDFEDNVAQSAEIARVTHSMGVALETELGKVGGLPGKDGRPAENIYTDPRLAAEFVERTQSDFLAVSIGTVHGVYTASPKLDLERLSEIRGKLDIPLVLHGGSGLSDQDFRDCIARGVHKVNIYTDVLNAATDKVRGIADEFKYPDINKHAETAMYEVAVEKMKIFNSANRY